MESKIIMLPIGQLEGHPDNPRKDVGDVTELADSIRHSGIMQNLTVVPYEGKYRVIIGHRRLAAAKLAGLTELPCLVSDMDYKEQCATMLCENMQRVDLTVPEQAQGVQLLLNLGESVDDIAKKTGFSKATIRKREKIAALPAEKLKEADERGATLEEYIKCTEIDDPKKRAELIDVAGTRNFDWNFNVAKRNQEVQKNFPTVKAIVKRFAKPFKENSDSWEPCYQQIERIDVQHYKDGDIDTSKIDSKKEYFYKVCNGEVYIYEKIKLKKKNPVKKSKKEIKADEARARLAGLTKTAFEMRSAFLEEFNVFTPQNERIIDQTIMILAAHKVATYALNNSDFLKNCIEPFKDNDSYIVTFPNVQAWFCHNRKKAKLQLLRAFFSDNERNGFYTARFCEIMPEYAKNERLQVEYNVLAELGYNISTEEMQLMNGTHEAFGGAKNE